jgi:fatty-acyl-CoA synthase
VLSYAGVAALVADAGMTEAATAVAAQLPALRSLAVVGREATAPDAAVDYEEALAATSPLPRQPRSPRDQILLLTGGTTGAPKGVVWDCAGVIDVVSSAFRRAEVPVPRDREELVAAARVAVRSGTTPVMLPGSPLMHGTGFFSTLGSLLRAGLIVTLPGRALDPAALWTAVQEHRVEELAIVGDAFAVPLLAELDRAAADGRPYDLNSLRRVFSSGVRWSVEVKRCLLQAGRMTLHDSIAATEGGPFGVSLAGPDPESVPSQFTLPPNARVIGPDGRDVVPGSGEVGMLACTGPLPRGYLDAPDQTAAVFREIDGVRYAVPGDAATVEADGTLTLLGRGAGVINTGGEKVFAEEVEQVLVEHPGVAEAVVVGVPDERWGSRITAMVVPESGAEPTEEELAEHVGRRLAGYKRPRSVFFVENVDRTVSGKLDRLRATERIRQLVYEQDGAPTAG